MNDILVIDDLRTFRFPATYARSAAEGRRLLLAHPWREIWLDHDLGPGEDIRPLVRMLEERAFAGDPLAVERIVVHSANPAGAADIARGLTARGYRVVRVLAQDYL